MDNTQLIYRAIEELKESYFYLLSEEEIIRIFEETAGKFLSEVFKQDVDFFLSQTPEFCIYKSSEVIREPISKLKKSVVKGMIAKVKKELRLRCEVEFLWKVYLKVKRNIKTLVKGKVLGKNGRDYYVEFSLENEENPLKPLKLIGICPLMDTTLSDRKNFKTGLKKLFMIKNCYGEKLSGTMRLTVVLSRQSRTFVRKLFELHGVPESEIVRVERKLFRTIVYSKKALSKDVIKKVAREIDEEVIVRYGNLWERKIKKQ